MVTSPEASGNKYLVQLLVDAGCAGKAGYKQPFDGPGYDLTLPDPPPKHIAFCRTMPHDKRWFDLGEIRRRLETHGYLVTFLVMVRDPSVVERSQVATGHVQSIHEARANIARAYRHIFTTMGDVNLHVVPYTSLSNPDFVRWLYGRLGLPTPKTWTPFTNGDLKYKD